MKKWFSSSDLRKSEQVMGEILSFIDENGVKSVSMIQEIIGCPHEEGIDYPEVTISLSATIGKDAIDLEAK